LRCIAEVALVLFLIVGPAPGAEAAAPPAWSVPIHLSLPRLAEAGVWPVTVGVPLPEGRLRDGSALAVVDGAQRLPVQARVQSRWPDGSVRWLLLDWQSHLDPGATRRVQLEPVASAPIHTGPLRIRRSDAGVRVDTGKASYSIPSSGDDLLATIAADGSPSSRLSLYAIVDAVRHDAVGARNIEILEDGPWRSRVAVRGGYGPLRYEIRFDFFAGNAAVRVLASTENHASNDYVGLDELAITLRPAQSKTGYRIGVEPGRTLRGVLGAAPVTLVQTDARSMRFGEESRTGQGSGWASIADESGRGAAIAARFFWQEYPQGFVLRPESATYHLKAPTKRQLAFGSGAAKTHEFWVLLDGAKEFVERLPDLSQPVIAWTDPTWVATSSALRNAISRGGDSDAFLDRLGVSIGQYAQSQDREEWADSGRVTCDGDDVERRVGAYGMFNWGDWNFRGYRDTIKGCDAWGNLEYDTTQVLGLAFAATGDARSFELMTASARHFADVDRIHFSKRHPGWVGMNHPKNPLHFTFELGGIDLGHTWNEGLFTYGLLTGDERALRAGREIADYLVRRRGAGIGFRGNPRQWGWPMVALVAAWEMSADERYREAALWYAQRGMFAHPADAPGDWKRGILAEGLAYVHSITGEPTILVWLQTYAKAIVESRPADSRYYPAVAYVGGITASESWRRVARDKAADLQLGRWGKPMTIGGRTGFALLAPLPPLRTP